MVLWGDRAIEFEEEAVRARDEKEAVIAIFIGTLPKINQGGQPIASYTTMHSILYNLFILLFNNYAGVQGLSGSSACRWYIDEDLPVINDFHNR